MQEDGTYIYTHPNTHTNMHIDIYKIGLSPFVIDCVLKLVQSKVRDITTGANDEKNVELHGQQLLSEQERMQMS